MTINLVLAIFAVVGGIILISTQGKSKMGKSDMSEGSLAKGVFAAFGAVLCFAVSPLLVKIGLGEVSSPLLATFISYTAAGIVVGGLLLHPGNYKKLRRLDHTSWLLFIAGGVVIAMAQVFRYSALSYSPVSLVAPLTGTRSLFLLPLSFVINRRIEAFSMRNIVGVIAIVAGGFLIFWIA